MVKKLVCSTALLVALAFLFTGLAFAQRPRPTATIHEQGLPRPTGGNHVAPGGLIPTFCNPCLFYGGDGDPNNANADGLWDNNSSDFAIDAQVYSPFIVPAKTGKCGGKCKWGVSGLFAALELNPYILGVGPGVPPTDAVWAVYTGVVTGGTPSTATTVCSGTDPSPTFTDTGRLYFGFYEEFAMSVAVSGCTLAGKGKAGIEYWEQVTPEFGATGTFQLSYESNVPDSPPPNALGTEPVDQSFFYGPAFGFTSFSPAQNLGPFHIFSAGVEGTLVKK
jgi:hypothetical protein